MRVVHLALRERPLTCGDPGASVTASSAQPGACLPLLLGLTRSPPHLHHCPPSPSRAGQTGRQADMAEGVRLMKRDGVDQTEARAGGEGGLTTSTQPPPTACLVPGLPLGWAGEAQCGFLLLHYPRPASKGEPRFPLCSSSPAPWCRGSMLAVAGLQVPGPSPGMPCRVPAKVPA